MADPTAYARSFDFSDYQTNNPSAPYPGAQDDAQFDAVAAATADLVSAIKDVRRSDGALKNGIVTPDSLSQGTLNMLDGAYVFRGSWLTATAYAVKDVVNNGTSTYVCAAAHTSGTFATDLAASKWVLIAAVAVGYTTTADATTIANAQITSLALKLDTSNGPLTGNLTIQKSNPTVTLRKTAAGEGSFIGGTNGASLRWAFALGDATLESGSNAGSNVVFYRYDDTGAFLGSALTIYRSTGKAAFAAAPSSSVDGSAATDLTTLQQVEGMLIGSFAAFGGGTAPAGWLICDGRNVSRATYAKLFTAISTTWGSGDGSTTFTLPDLRGRALFGRDDMGGSAASRITNAISGVNGATRGATGGDQRAHAHNHGVTDPSHSHGFSGGGTVGGAGGGLAGGSGAVIASGVVAANTTGISIQTWGAGGSQNMPPCAIADIYIFAGTV